MLAGNEFSNKEGIIVEAKTFGKIVKIGVLTRKHDPCSAIKYNFNLGSLGVPNSGLLVRRGFSNNIISSVIYKSSNIYIYITSNTPLLQVILYI